VTSKLYNYGRLMDPEGSSLSTLIMSRDRILRCMDCFHCRTLGHGHQSCVEHSSRYLHLEELEVHATHANVIT
jgi:hypothetical protein